MNDMIVDLSSLSNLIKKFSWTTGTSSTKNPLKFLVYGECTEKHKGSSYVFLSLFHNREFTCTFCSKGSGKPETGHPICKF